MTVSLTQEAATAATAASAAVPPASRTAAPASAVAGCPAATAGCKPIRYPRTQTAASAVRLLPWAARWDCRDALERGEPYEPHQGREAGDHPAARPRECRHGLDRGPGRDAHASDQPAHRAPPDAQARPS